eukprot:1997305-Prymnesium_polylepis.3
MLGTGLGLGLGGCVVSWDWDFSPSLSWWDWTSLMDFSPALSIGTRNSVHIITKWTEVPNPALRVAWACSARRPLTRSRSG